MREEYMKNTSGDAVKNSAIEPLLKRAFMFLEDGKWVEADDYCEKVLDQEPENAQAYLGKLMAEMKVSSQENLKDCEQPFDQCDSYKKIICFADDELKKTLAGYIDYIVERNENACLDSTYNRAHKFMEEAKTTLGYKKAAQLFASIEDYKDSAELIQKCHDQAKKKEKQFKKIAVIATPIFCIAVAFVIVLNAVIIPSNNYNNAIAQIDAGDVIAAYETLAGLNGYKDSTELANSIYEKYEVEKAAQAKVGDYILFGAYEQDNDTSNGQEKIEWKVLEKGVDRILVISKYVLNNQNFASESDAYITVYNKFSGKFEIYVKPFLWKFSSLRSWLNNNFLDYAFTDNEQSRILTTTSYFNSTTSSEKIFLLDYSEASEYFDLDNRSCSPTDYADAKGAGKADNGNCSWWLRSPGDDEYHIDVVNSNGEIKGSGNYSSSNGVRPAMWISIK